MTEFKNLFLIGLGIKKPNQQNYVFLGMAIGAGKPSDKLAGNEAILEMFYRIKLTHFLQVTPDIHLVNLKPANHNRKWGAVSGLRLRAAG